VDGDDWEGLYVDGLRRVQGHHVRLEEVFQALGIDGKRVFANTRWLEEQGYLPQKLEDVKLQ
jgi:hypothetical protein